MPSLAEMRQSQNKITKNLEVEEAENASKKLEALKPKKKTRKAKTKPDEVSE